MFFKECTYKDKIIFSQFSSSNQMFGYSLISLKIQKYKISNKLSKRHKNK